MNVGQLKQLLKSTGLDDEALVLIETGAVSETSLEEVTRATASIDFGGASALIIRQPDQRATAPPA